jgi:hypothetical protein
MREAGAGSVVVVVPVAVPVVVPVVAVAAAGSDWFFNSVPKFVPGAEVPVLVGVSVLRRNAGGV